MYNENGLTVSANPALYPRGFRGVQQKLEIKTTPREYGIVWSSRTRETIRIRDNNDGLYHIRVNRLKKGENVQLVILNSEDEILTGTKRKLTFPPGMQSANWSRSDGQTSASISFTYSFVAPKRVYSNAPLNIDSIFVIRPFYSSPDTFPSCGTITAQSSPLDRTPSTLSLRHTLINAGITMKRSPSISTSNQTNTQNSEVSVHGERPMAGAYAESESEFQTDSEDESSQTKKDKAEDKEKEIN